VKIIRIHAYIVINNAAELGQTEYLEAYYLSTSERVERLTPSLLAKAFRGERVEETPNDELGPVLLERIREGREKE
jgi:type I restriction enzyme S subunit